MYINIFHTSSPFTFLTPPMDTRLKGKRQQRDGQIDLGFAPNAPPRSWVWRQGGNGGGVWVGVWVGGKAGMQDPRLAPRLPGSLRLIGSSTGRYPGLVSIRPCSCLRSWTSPPGQLVGGLVQLVGGPSTVARKRGRRRATALGED